MKNYVCMPKKEMKPCAILCVSILFLSAVVFFLSRYMASFRTVGQMIGIAILLLFVQLSSKCFFTSYSYALEGNKLSIFLRQGNRKKNLGYIPLSENVILFTKKEWEEREENPEISQCFSYCQNLFPKNASYLIFPQEGRNVLLIFEPDETLHALLKERI